jgi:hypothetical protein
VRHPGAYRARVPAAARALLLAGAVVAGAVAGLLGSFVHPLTVLRVPVGLLLALGLSAGVFVTAGLLRGRPAAVAAAVGWVTVVLLLASPRPEGDLVVPASATGYGWLFGGTLLAGCCVAVPYQRAARRTAQPSATADGGR